MRICGIIAEYNPFHNGHGFHLEKARALSDADYVVVLMSGSFTQRGEAAFLDKWTRARMALMSGADMVIELPAIYAVRAARDFAMGGVALLDALGCTDISFGSEVDDLDALLALRDFLREENPAFRKALHAHLAEGMGYVAAYAKAAQSALPESPFKEAQLKALQSPNATLGLEYLRALGELGSRLEPHVARRAHDYHDPAIHPLASASAIRRRILEGSVEEVKAAIPSDVYQCCVRALKMGDMVDASVADIIGITLLRGYTPDDIARFPDISEGLENRAYQAIRQSGSMREFLESMQTRRYTRARLRRLCAHGILSMTIDDVPPRPTYARVLGYRRDSQKLIGILSQRADIPVIVRASDMGTAPAPFWLDVRGTDMRALMLENPTLRAAGQDFTNPPTVV